jgi:hypothetical protein
LRAASPVLLMQLWSHSAAAAAAAAPKHRENLERDEEVTMSLTHLDSTLACIVSSTHSTLRARNSALTLRGARGRPSEGGVLSRGRPSPEAGVSAMAKQRGGRKMLTSLTPCSMWPCDTCLAAPHRCLNRPRHRLIGGLTKRGISLAQAGPHRTEPVTVWRTGFCPGESSPEAIFLWTGARSNNSSTVQSINHCKFF